MDEGEISRRNKAEREKKLACNSHHDTLACAKVDGKRKVMEGSIPSYTGATT